MAAGMRGIRSGLYKTPAYRVQFNSQGYTPDFMDKVVCSLPISAPSGTLAVPYGTTVLGEWIQTLLFSVISLWHWNCDHPVCEAFLCSYDRGTRVGLSFAVGTVSNVC
jgi:hypothetical protein